MITLDMLKKLAPKGNAKILSELAAHLDTYLPKYEVNTYLRLCHFIAQAAHESAGFKTLEEYASGAAYEGRKDLGNTVKGDGKRYKGRGIFQLTGRANYKAIGDKLGVNLVDNPDLAATGEISVQTALEYWKSRGLNAFADKDDVLTITKKINGGTNGLDDRKQYLAKAKTIIPQDIKPEPAPKPATQTLNIVMAKQGDRSSYVRDLQNMLVKKGYKVAADGIYGPGTTTAVQDFQQKNKLEITGNIDTNTINLLMSL